MRLRSGERAPRSGKPRRSPLRIAVPRIKKRPTRSPTPLRNLKGESASPRCEPARQLPGDDDRYGSPICIVSPSSLFLRPRFDPTTRRNAGQSTENAPRSGACATLFSGRAPRENISHCAFGNKSSVAKLPYCVWGRSEIFKVRDTFLLYYYFGYARVALRKSNG